MERSWLTKLFLLCFLFSAGSGDYWYHCNSPDTVERWIACNTRTSIEGKLVNATRQIINGLRILIQGKSTERLAYCPEDVNGEIDIYPSCSDKKTVYCEGVNQTTSKLQIFYRNDRTDPDVFERHWRDYKNGFGGEDHFWIGLQSLAALNKLGEYKLIVEAKTKERNESAEWQSFWVEGEEAGYKLHVGDINDYYSRLGDFSPRYNNKKFTTYDNDSDEWESGNCAELMRGGWWYSTCPDDEHIRRGPDSQDWIPTLRNFKWSEFKMFIQPNEAIPIRKCYGPNGDQDPVDLD